MSYLKYNSINSISQLISSDGRPGGVDPQIDAETGEVLSPGLSSSHTSPLLFWSGHRKPFIRAWPGGKLLELVHEKSYPHLVSYEPPVRVAGDIKEFSHKSRLRLMRKFAQLDLSGKLPYFLTLTYDDIFDKDPRRWKRDLDVFGKRLLRAYPDAGAIWRIEFVKRKSGANKGNIAPHFHLFVWNVGPLGRFRPWLSNAWTEVTGGSEKHFRAGCRAETVRTANGVMNYASKYAAKVDRIEGFSIGRRWGVIGRQNVPFADPVIITLAQEDLYQVQRWVWRSTGLRPHDVRGKRTFAFATASFWVEKVANYFDLVPF